MAIDPPDDIELELIESTGDVDVRRPARASSAAVGGPFDFTFDGELYEWRGPAPYHFIAVPPDAARAIASVAADVTYGWGMIPVRVRIGGSAWETSLWPKDGGYVLPIKDQFRKAERIELGDVVAVGLGVRR